MSLYTVNSEVDIYDIPGYKYTLNHSLYVFIVDNLIKKKTHTQYLAF